MPKHWTPTDQDVLEQACSTGRLPDGRGASQNRLALYLGFSRQTIVNHLNGRQLPLHCEAMSQGAKMSAYVRRLKRTLTMVRAGGKVRVRHVRRNLDSPMERIEEIAGESADAIDEIKPWSRD